MTELDEIQVFFAAQIRSRRALTRDGALSARADALIRTTGALSAVERLEIYREQFWLRHTSSLVEDFPGLSGILGQRAWAALIEGYLETHPPHSYTLRDLGLLLPAYIAGQSALEHHELCTDMARLELAYLEIFDAADAPAITPEALAAVSEEAWQGVRIVFHPALRLLKTPYPVAALRRRLIEARTTALRLPMPGLDPHYHLLFRRDLQLFHEPISEGAYALLSALTRRVPLLAACEQAQAEAPSDAASIAENASHWFQSWAARGFVTAVEP